MASTRSAMSSDRLLASEDISLPMSPRASPKPSALRVTSRRSFTVRLSKRAFCAASISFSESTISTLTLSLSRLPPTVFMASVMGS